KVRSNSQQLLQETLERVNWPPEAPNALSMSGVISPPPAIRQQGEERKIRKNSSFRIVKHNQRIGGA
ncbi:hypothetical protein ACFQ2Q_16025, partial [Shinella fusca]|uniref:hypothetical protein n=1 Tax=Shinella fusca TaxID=544480 RepID=UPI003644BD7E